MEQKISAKAGDKLAIKIGKNRNLVAATGYDAPYKEIFLSIEDDNGCEVRDLVVVRPSYTYDKDGNVCTTKGSYDVLLKTGDNTDYEDAVVYTEKISVAEQHLEFWQSFEKSRKGLRKKSGCWDVCIQNIKTEEIYSTQGDIHVGTTWPDFFEWLVGDIEEMDIGSVDDCRVVSLEYAGKDQYWED